MKKTSYLLSLLILAAVGGCQQKTTTEPPHKKPPAETLSWDAFDSPDDCAGCHPNHYQEWQTSMHAYAFTDPVFFTLERIAQERSGNALDQFCVKCHSPLASVLGKTPPGFSRDQVHDIGKKGITCDVCHTRKDAVMGEGIKSFRLDGVKQGPLPDPKANDYHESSYDTEYAVSDFCEPCHNVLAPNGLFVERTSQEWDESPYGAMGMECQACHMPKYRGQAATDGPVRDDVHHHHFTGVDIPVTDFPGRENTIRLVDEMLKNSVTMRVQVPAQVSANETLAIRVTIDNDQTGHNIPTGTIFERQMWIEVVVRNAASGDTVYASGLLDANEDLMNHHSELVADGTIPEDVDLTLFHGIPLKDGHETPFFWESDSIDNRTIPPFESRTSSYDVAPPFTDGDVLDVSVRLRFRTFPPYLLRAVGEADVVEKLVIFDMEEDSRHVSVGQ